MEELSLAAVAAMTARDVLRAHPGLGASGAEDLAHRLPATIELTLAAMAVSVAVGIPLGVVSAVWRNSVLDSLARLGALSVKSGASGAHYFDAFESRRFSYIGP